MNRTSKNGEKINLPVPPDLKGFTDLKCLSPICSPPSKICSTEEDNINSTKLTMAEIQEKITQRANLFCIGASMS